MRPSPWLIITPLHTPLTRSKLEQFFQSWLGSALFKIMPQSWLVWSSFIKPCSFFLWKMTAYQIMLFLLKSLKDFLLLYLKLAPPYSGTQTLLLPNFWMSTPALSSLFILLHHIGLLTAPWTYKSVPTLEPFSFRLLLPGLQPSKFLQPLLPGTCITQSCPALQPRGL